MVLSVAIEWITLPFRLREMVRCKFRTRERLYWLGASSFSSVLQANAGTVFRTRAHSLASTSFPFHINLAVPGGLRRRSAAARLLGSWVRISPGAWTFVCCECCVFSGRGLDDELITRPEESYRLWCVVMYNLQTSWMRSHTLSVVIELNRRCITAYIS